jgi:hypothetical protein
MRQWKVLARHKWVAGCTITESINLQDDSKRKFTATIRGWRNFLLFEGDSRTIDANNIQAKVIEIRNLIDQGNEEVFTQDHMIS